MCGLVAVLLKPEFPSAQEAEGTITAQANEHSLEGPCILRSQRIALPCADAKSQEEQRTEIWTRFRQLLVLAQERGTHASGVGIIRQQGPCQILKGPVCATQLVKEGEFDSLGASLDASVVAMLGHARRTTRGSASNNHNNHPIHVNTLPGIHGGAVGVHNGTISNDDALFCKYGYPRHGEVDSEIIFHLLAEACHSKTRRNERIVDFIGELEGSMSFICSLLDEPSVVYVFRGTEPLAWHFESRLNALFIASLPQHLREVFRLTSPPPLFERHAVFRFHVDGQQALLQPERFEVEHGRHEQLELGFQELRRIAQQNLRRLAQFGWQRSEDDWSLCPISSWLSPPPEQQAGGTSQAPNPQEGGGQLLSLRFASGRVIGNRDVNASPGELSFLELISFDTLH